MENKLIPGKSLMAERYLMPTYHKEHVIAVPSWKKENVYVLPGNIETSSDELVVNGFTMKIMPLWSRFWIEVRT